VDQAVHGVYKSSDYVVYIHKQHNNNMHVGIMYNEMIPSNTKREERFNKQRFVHESPEVHMYAGMYAEADTFKISN